MRTPVLVLTLTLIGVIGALTVDEVVNHGVDPITAFALLVVALFGFGIVGALRHPPEE